MPVFYHFFNFTLWKRQPSVTFLPRKSKIDKIYAASGHHFFKIVVYEIFFLDHSLLADSYNRTCNLVILLLKKDKQEEENISRQTTLEINQKL